MNRREFIAGLGVAAAWPLAARAQQAGVPVVGWLDHTVATNGADRIAALRQGLSAAGFVEGRNLAIEPRWANYQRDRLPAMAADLVRMSVAAIVTNNTATAAARAATSTIPIVFVTGGDPVESGLVTRLKQPGGNVTGVGFLAPTLNPKRLALLHELVPKPALMAAVMDANLGGAGIQEVQAAARMLDRKILIEKAGNVGDIDAAFMRIAQAGAGAVFVGNGGFFLSERQRLVALAARYALPATYHLRSFVEAGGLMSYGASDTDAYRRAGLYVGRILKGERPGDLPVELPTRYELIVNLKTAKALGLTIPPNLLAIADDVIE